MVVVVVGGVSQESHKAFTHSSDPRTSFPAPRSPTLQICQSRRWQCHCQVVNSIKNGADDVVLVETGEAQLNKYLSFPVSLNLPPIMDRKTFQVAGVVMFYMSAALIVYFPIVSWVLDPHHVYQMVIDPWPDIDFNWRLEAQLCADKEKNHQRPIKDSALADEMWLRSEAQRWGENKITEKCPHIAWLCHANQRRRQTLHDQEALENKVEASMDIKKCNLSDILLLADNSDEHDTPSYPLIDMRTDISNSSAITEWQSLEDNVHHSWVLLVIIMFHHPLWKLRC